MAQVRVITRYQQNPFDLRPPKVGSRQLTDSHLGPGTSWDLLGPPGTGTESPWPQTFHPNATFVLYFWMHPPNTFRPSEARKSTPV